MSLKNKTVMVTGGAGFIGSHLVDRLIQEKPEKIVVVDNFFLGKDENLNDAQGNFDNLKVYREDVSNYEKMESILKEDPIDILYNLAVVPLPTSLEKPSWTYQHNVEIAISICELIRNNYFDTLIHFSSSEVYGTSVYAPMDEKHPLNGTTTYAASKSSSDLLVFSYCRTFGIDASIIRPFNNFGPRQNEGSYAGVIPITIMRILEGKRPIICGDGKQTRDYLYVTDTAEAAIKIYGNKNTRNRVLNIASGKEISIEYLVKFISSYLNFKEGPIYRPERAGDVKRHIANVFLAEDIINFHPTVSFEEGMINTIEWYTNKLSNNKI